MLDADEINALVDLMEARCLAEVEIEQDGRRLRVTRALAGQPPGAAAVGVAADPAPASDAHAVTAPMTGTFYRAPGPDQAPFVEVGQQVAAGDVVCIIESMKMMNRIEADRAGTVTAIVVDNGAPVDAGQTLLLIA